jgi:hypothetical protein
MASKNRTNGLGVVKYATLTADGAEQRVALVEYGERSAGFAYCPPHEAYFTLGENQMVGFKEDVEGSNPRSVEVRDREGLDLVKIILSVARESVGQFSPEVNLSLKRLQIRADFQTQ